jgi:hypothetical protein
MAALPRLARRLHDVLGESMARLHRLDPTPVRARLFDADVGGLGVAVLLSGFTEAAGRCDRADLVAAARWLEEHPPAPSPEVICHGDLHPFNLLVDADGEVTVLDWSASLLAPGAYDLAFTGLVFAEPPVAVCSVRWSVLRAGGWGTGSAGPTAATPPSTWTRRCCGGARASCACARSSRSRAGSQPARSRTAAVTMAGVRSRLRRASLDADRCFGHIPLRTVSGARTAVRGLDSCGHANSVIVDLHGDLRAVPELS